MILTLHPAGRWDTDHSADCERKSEERSAFKRPRICQATGTAASTSSQAEQSSQREIKLR
jgi:hypothetical protein